MPSKISVSPSMTVARLVTLLACICSSVLVIGDPENFISDNRKIAFLFLVRGHVPLEDIWREFFNFKADPQHYSIYIHPHHGFKYPKTSFFHGKEIPNTQNVKWGGMTQVKAIKHLVREALKDPKNDWFTLMSETCIPVHPFPVWRTAFAKQTKSMFNACPMHPSEMETDTRWRPSLDKVGLNKSHWRKSATWFALNRKHAEVFVNETVTEAAWDPVPCCDEHYLPTILAFNGLDNETTCTDGFAHVYWESLTASHPHWFSADEVSEELFSKRFHRPPNSGGGQGFSQLCSGNADICHFTARKFSWNTRYALLENIHLVLNDNKSNLVYDKDQWAHYNERLRVTNDSKYFVLDSGYWRQVPDMYTLHAMHLNESKALELSETDKAGHQFGTTYPSRRDGQALKAPKRNYIFLIKGGKKRGIPNMETLAALGMGLWNVSIVNEWDLEQIPMGHPVPDVKSSPDVKAQLVAGTF